MNNINFHIAWFIFLTMKIIVVSASFNFLEAFVAYDFFFLIEDKNVYFVLLNKRVDSTNIEITTKV